MIESTAKLPHLFCSAMIGSFPTNCLCAEEEKATIQRNYFTHHEHKTDGAPFDSEPEVKLGWGLGMEFFYLLWFLINQKLGKYAHWSI